MNIQTDMALAAALEALRRAEKAAKGSPEQRAVEQLSQALNRLLREKGFAVSPLRRGTRYFRHVVELVVPPERGWRPDGTNL